MAAAGGRLNRFWLDSGLQVQDGLSPELLAYPQGRFNMGIYLGLKGVTIS